MQNILEIGLQKIFIFWYNSKLIVKEISSLRSNIVIYNLLLYYMYQSHVAL